MIYGENLVIKKQTADGHFDWVGRCPHCGHIELSGTSNDWIGSNSRGSRGSKRCSKCGTVYSIEVRND